MLDFTIFLKGQERKEINTKASQNAYEMHKFMKFCYSMKKTGKITEVSKKSEFWLDLHCISLTIDIQIFLRRMKEQLLKVSAPLGKSSFCCTSEGYMVEKVTCEQVISPMLDKRETIIPLSGVTLPRGSQNVFPLPRNCKQLQRKVFCTELLG